MSKIRLFLMFGVLGFAVLVAAGAQAESLVPHRALYEIKLVKPKSGSSIVSGNGFMSIQYEKACDGWITGQTWRMNMNSFDGKTFNNDIRYATWESFDGLSFRFS
ncbi:MAG: DUF1849 family protein, partial [Rhodospirillales bacterium]